MAEPIAIVATIIPDAEAFIRDNIADIYSCLDTVCAIVVQKKLKFDPFQNAVYCDEGGQDDPPNNVKTCTMNDHVQALKLLADLIGQRKLFVGGITNPADLADLGQWDAEVADAFMQLCYRGEVIYG